MTSPQRSDCAPPQEDLGAILGRLTAAGTPWLGVIPARTGLPAQRDGVTIIDVTDMRGAPVTVNPFEPERGCSVQSHADRLVSLFEAAFRPPAPARAALRLGLRRAYADCGWDAATGAALPGAVAPPGVPSINDVRRAVLRETTELGASPGQRAAVRGFLDVQLSSLWTGPAGQFLAAGHPLDLSGLTRRNVLFTVGDVADTEAATFLTGVLLIRLVEQLRARQHDDTPGAVVLAVPAARLRRLLDEISGYGASVITAAYGPSAHRQESTGPAGSPSNDAPPPAPLELRGRRSAACGLQCRQRPCSGYELHEAELLARADSQVWLRLWAQVLVLAFLTGRPLPHVPVALRRNWPSLDARTRECLLATVVRAAVASRALALRHTYDPRRLEAAIATTGAGLLAAAVPSAATRRGMSHYLAARIPLRAGQIWVIPQLRWLHEVDRLNPLGPRRVGREDIAPPLDFELAGLPDWPGIRVGDRLDGLRRHRLCMDSERNRGIAMNALLGTDRAGTDRGGADRGGHDEDGTGLDADLAIAGIGLGHVQRLRYAQRMLGIIQRGAEPGWLEVVLSWPTRLIRPDNIRPR